MLATRLHKKLDEIAEFLLHNDDSNLEVGVLSGISGNALFHFNYGDFTNNDDHINKGIEIITEVFDRIQKGYNHPTFCDGIAGACWTLELLKAEKKIELEEDIITEEVDIFLYNKMKEFIAKNDFDFLHGAIGIGFYFLKRYENYPQKKRYKKYLDFLLDELSNKSIETKGLIYWESTIISGEYIAQGCNLGLAHGIPSIINFLSRLSKIDAFSSNALRLLKPACDYMLSLKHQDPKFSSSFPNWIETDKENEQFNSRLAWCYGDLGIGITIYRAGLVLNDKELIDESIDIMMKSTKRRDITEAGIKDAGVCHGAYGLMLIYNDFYNKTKIREFKETAEYWANEALNLGSHKDGFAGYKEHQSPVFKPSSTLLGGISGIGLTILDFLEYQSKWSEALLID